MPGFYSANEHRAYPLVDADAGIPIPDAVVVDFGCVMGVRALFEDGVHSVWLSRLARSGTTYTFEFSSDAPGMDGRVLRFARDLAAAEYATDWATAGGGASSSSSSADANEECADDPIAEAFLATGLLSELPDLLGDGDELTDAAGLTRVEPGLIQNLGRSFVRSINLANRDRVRVEPADGCEDAAPSGEAVFATATCLTGALKLKEGYNCSIRVSPGDNSVTVSGAVGGGEGQPCDEVPVHPGESKPDGSTLYTGGPACTEVLKSINGIGGRVVRLVSGDGVRIEPSTAENTLIVEVDMHGMALCVRPEDVVSSSVAGGES